MKLSILIPTTPNRRALLDKLKEELYRQIDNKEVEIIELEDNFEMSIGEKRNKLVEMATGEYVVFIDSDDWVSEDYIDEMLKGISYNPDVIGIHCFLDSDNPRPFVHSLQYDTWKKIAGVETKPPSHLTPIKKSIAIQVPFIHKNYMEDTTFAKDLMKSKLLKTEWISDKVLYFYRYDVEKSDSVKNRHKF